MKRSKAPHLAGDKPLVLIGFMGSGKTSVGKQLANRLEVPFIDCDRELTRSDGRTVKKIFAESGEPFFRRLESRVLKRLIRNRTAVIAAGGGVIVQKANRRLLRQKTHCVWLKVSLPTVLGRVSRSRSRPLVTAAGKSGRGLKDLMKERTAWYKEAAHFIVNQDRATPREGAARVLKAIGGILHAR